MSNPTPIPYSELQSRKNNLVTTIVGDGVYNETSYDYFSKSRGKLTDKPDDVHRNKLMKRAREHIALAHNMAPTSKLQSPSEKKSEAMRKKLRNKKT